MADVKPSALDRKKKDDERSKKEKEKRGGKTHRVKQFKKGTGGHDDG